MPGTNSSNLKKTCVNCHFFAYAMKYYSHKSNQYSEEVVDQYYRNWIREKCYNDNQSTEIPEECNYLRGYNNEKASDLYIVGLKCYKNVWPVIEYSIERIPRTLDIKTCSFLHTVPKYREKAFEEITEVDRSGSCFFCEYKRGMSFEAGVELERRAAQNNSITKPDGMHQECQMGVKDVVPTLYKKTPKDAKWQGLTMAFPSHLEGKVDIEFNENVDFSVSLNDLGFVDKKATKKFKPLEALVLLKQFAKNKKTYLLHPKDERERKNLYAQVESLRKTLKQCFGIDGDPVPANDKGGYRLEFNAYCYNMAEKEELGIYLDSLKEYMGALKTEVGNSGKYRNEDNIQMNKQSIEEATKEILQRVPRFKLNDIICTECYQKILIYIGSKDNSLILCENCTLEPTNEYVSKSVIEYKDNDIPRSESSS